MHAHSLLGRMRACVMPSSMWLLACIWPLTSTSCLALVNGMMKLGTVLVRATYTSTPRDTSAWMGAALALPPAGPRCFHAPQSAQSVPRSQNTCDIKEALRLMGTQQHVQEEV